MPAKADSDRNKDALLADDPLNNSGVHFPSSTLPLLVWVLALLLFGFLAFYARQRQSVTALATTEYGSLR